MKGGKCMNNMDMQLAAVDAVLAGDDRALDMLVDNPDENVRVIVAKAARPQDLDKLVNDPSRWVRLAVIHYGRPEDRQKLVNDPDPVVRLEART